MPIFGESEINSYIKIFVNLKLFAVILLAGLFLFDAVGYQVLFAFLILQQAEEMQYLISEFGSESLEVIVIDSLVQYNFSQVNEKEFLYKGNLYDIKSKEIKDGKIIIYCKKDEKELDLLNHFSKMNDENKTNTSKNPLSRILQKTVQNLFFTRLQFLDSLFPKNKFYNTIISLFYEQPDSFQLTPPPQIHFS